MNSNFLERGIGEHLGVHPILEKVLFLSQSIFKNLNYQLRHTFDLPLCICVETIEIFRTSSGA